MSNDVLNDEQEYIDYIFLDGIKQTPDRVTGSIRLSRDKYFDLELVALPIISESSRLLRPERERMTQEELYQLDNSPYILTHGSAGERRFLTEFDYYSALIRACEDNADQVFHLKREITRRYHMVEMEYWKQYDRCLSKYGKEVMGRSESERNAWFHQRYPALYEIHMLYEQFLEEIDCELERWQSFARSASRQLSSTELGYQSSGKLYTNKRGKYAIEE